jgi:nicotinic acid mononucleotide adenylyltransferase
MSPSRGRRERLDYASVSDSDFKGNVLIFGLSANPPTGLGGHAGIVRWAATRTQLEAFQGEGVDQVWVLPVYRHAFSTKRDMPAFEHRLAMARIAFDDEMPDLASRVRVLDVERTLGRAAQSTSQAKAVRVGTIDVLGHLQGLHPQARLGLLLGADTYRDLKAGKWKNAEALQAMAPVVALPRVGVLGAARSDGPTLSAVSSTEVRGSSDLDFLRQALQPGVLAYIREHRLYGFAAEDEKNSDPR